MIVILGRGGHAKVCADVLNLRGLDFKTVEFDLSVDAKFSGKDDYVIGVGDIPTRRALYSRVWNNLINFSHPSAVVADNCKVGHGIQIMAGAIIQPSCTIGNNVLINTRASIDHDCIIGDHVHIAPGAILCGGVTVGEGAFIGAGAILTEGVAVPPGAFVKAGSLNDIKYA